MLMIRYFSLCSISNYITCATYISVLAQLCTVSHGVYTYKHDIVYNCSNFILIYRNIK